MLLKILTFRSYAPDSLMSTHNIMFLWRGKKNISILWMKKSYG